MIKEQKRTGKRGNKLEPMNSSKEGGAKERKQKGGVKKTRWNKGSGVNRTKQRR